MNHRLIANRIPVAATMIMRRFMSLGLEVLVCDPFCVGVRDGCDVCAAVVEVEVDLDGGAMYLEVHFIVLMSKTYVSFDVLPALLVKPPHRIS
jgi:hypothetical protein